MTSPGVSDATGRIALRRRRSGRRRLLVGAVVVALLATLGGLGWLAIGSDALVARTVRVTGTKVLSPDEVRSIADIRLNTPLVFVDPGAVAERVSGLPAVAKVSVARSWPDAVSIDITERVPAFAVESGEGFLIADATGVIFQASLTLPRGVVLAKVQASEGRLIADLATVVRALPDGLRTRVKQMRAETPDTITIALTDGTEILWGSAEQSELKAQVVVQLLKQKGRTYDVSAPSHPTVR